MTIRGGVGKWCHNGRRKTRRGDEGTSGGYSDSKGTKQNLDSQRPTTNDARGTYYVTREMSGLRLGRNKESPRRNRRIHRCMSG